MDAGQFGWFRLNPTSGPECRRRPKFYHLPRDLAAFLGSVGAESSPSSQDVLHEQIEQVGVEFQ